MCYAFDVEDRHFARTNGHESEITIFAFYSPQQSVAGTSPK